MICRRFKQIFSIKQIQYHCEITPRNNYHSQSYWLRNVITFIGGNEYSMQPMLKLRNFVRLWSYWTRTCIVNSVVRRCSREKVVKDVVQRFRHTILRPRNTLLISATAAYRSSDDNVNDNDTSKNITDEELEALMIELDNVEEISHQTLYCVHCDKRLVVDRKHPGIVYCGCKETQPMVDTYEGWVPFMEAEDVVIWRKEYKKGEGLYAYKIYGRYSEVRAQDFAAIQVDNEYRRQWDTAVASLSVVENEAYGIKDQAVLHWEVLWPKLFANRDYVYIRRHKDYAVRSKTLKHKDRLFSNATTCINDTEGNDEKIYSYQDGDNVHARAKRISQEIERKRIRDAKEAATVKDNRVFVIISKSCEHPGVPETKHAIRVTEYWSHMVIRTLDGSDMPGMEYVLTYYDEPSTGVLPTGVTAWATGRAAPNYLDKMRRAADHYQAWLRSQDQTKQETGVTAFLPEEQISEQTNNQRDDNSEVKNVSTQTEDQTDETDTKMSSVDYSKENSEDSEESNSGWWKYLHPYYYFV